MPPAPVSLAVLHVAVVALGRGVCMGHVSARVLEAFDKFTNNNKKKTPQNRIKSQSEQQSPALLPRELLSRGNPC